MKSRTDADKDEYMMYALTSALEASKEGKEHFARMKDVVNDSPRACATPRACETA